MQRKTIGIFLPDGFADWEYSLLAAGAAEHFGARIVYLTETAKTVRSIGGLVTKGERDSSPQSNADLDALALIGSEQWTGDRPPEIAPLARSVLDRGGIVGGICAATTALARNGFFDARRHTSNGRDWLMSKTGGYSGSASYVETAAAVRDGQIVSASGEAPVTFAAEFLEALYPQTAAPLKQFKSMFAAEHGS